MNDGMFFQDYFDGRYNTWFVFRKKPMVFESVGADSIRPVVSPLGKQRRRICADNGSIKHLQTKFGGIMSKHGTLRHVVPRDSRWESPGG